MELTAKAKPTSRPTHRVNASEATELKRLCDKLTLTSAPHAIQPKGAALCFSGACGIARSQYPLQFELSPTATRVRCRVRCHLFLGDSAYPQNRERVGDQVSAVFLHPETTPRKDPYMWLTPSTLERVSLCPPCQIGLEFQDTNTFACRTRKPARRACGGTPASWWRHGRIISPPAIRNK